MLDTLIRGATVYDGDGVEPRSVAVGIQSDRIALVGEEPIGAAAHEVIDARGLYLCPGFIDTHASTGLGYTLPRAGDHKLCQGVTTEIIGNCGTSSGPIGELLVPTMERLAKGIGFELDWRSLGEWFERVESYGLPFNAGTFVGHSTLRAGLLADAREEIGADERRRLGELLESGLADGALGLSTGLIYAPGSFAETSEIVELARIAARFLGLYVSHIRDERQGLEDAVDEAIEIGSAAGLPVLISHLKAAERLNWGKIPRILERIETVRAEGQPVSFEVYPYTAVSTKLRAHLPKAALADGVEALPELLAAADWRQRTLSWLRERGTDFATMVLITESVPGARGKSVAALAADLGMEAAEMALDLVIADPEAWIVYDCIDPGDMELALLWPHSIVCSDSWSYPVNATSSIGDPHPRTYGAFTRFLERYALQGRLPFGHAIQKITSFPADWLGLGERGRVREGWFADLVLLDPARVRERATFEEPRQYSEGTVGVWVNGRRMLADGDVAADLPGQVLKRRADGPRAGSIEGAAR